MSPSGGTIAYQEPNRRSIRASRHLKNSDCSLVLFHFTFMEASRVEIPGKTTFIDAPFLAPSLPRRLLRYLEAEIFRDAEYRGR